MRVRLSDLEKEQVVMKQGMMDKSRQGNTLLTSISKGFAILKHHKLKPTDQSSKTAARRSKRLSLS